MLIPSKSKYKKQQKGRSFRKVNLAFRNATMPNFDEISLRALSSGRLSSENLLACKQTINKIIKRYGYLIVNLSADTPVSKKPTEIRMGKGKGAVNSWVRKVKPGNILFQIITKYKSVGIRALKLVQNKLPIDTKIIYYDKY